MVIPQSWPVLTGLKKAVKNPTKPNLYHGQTHKAVVGQSLSDLQNIRTNDRRHLHDTTDSHLVGKDML